MARLSDHEGFERRLRWTVRLHSCGDVSAFCKAMRLDRKTFYNWIDGKNIPTGKALTKLAVGGVDLNWLLTGVSVRGKKEKA